MRGGECVGNVRFLHEIAGGVRGRRGRRTRLNFTRSVRTARTKVVIDRHVQLNLVRPVDVLLRDENDANHLPVDDDEKDPSD